MSYPILLGSDRYQITWSDWWKYSVNGQDCKKRLINLLLDINEMLASVESGQYDNRDIFDCLEEVNDRVYLCDSAISCYSEVSLDSEIQQLQKELHTKTARLHQLKSRESFLISTFQRMGAIFGFSAAAGFERGRQLAVLDSREPSSVEELFEIENEKRRLLGQKGQIVLCKKKSKITQHDIDKQKEKVENLNRQYNEAEKKLAEAEIREGVAFTNLIDETSVGITITGQPKISAKLKDVLPYTKAHNEVYEKGLQRNKILNDYTQEQFKLNEMTKNFEIQENGDNGVWFKIKNFFFGAKKDSSGINVEGGVTIKF